MISKLASTTCKHSVLFSIRVSVAEETGLSTTLSETPKTGFVASRHYMYLIKLWLDVTCILSMQYLFGILTLPDLAAGPGFLLIHKGVGVCSADSISFFLNIP